MEIVPTPALAIAMVFPFLVTMIALWFLLFKPVLDYLAEREAVSHDARKEADGLNTKVEDRLSELQQRLATARSEVSAVRAAARSRALEQETHIVADARALAEARVRDATHQIVAEQKLAAEVLRETSKALSGQIASQILGREIST